MGEAKDNLPLASRLCLACGLCCDGTVYGHAISNDQERSQASDLGFQMISTDDGEPAFKLPCRYLEGTACSRYREWKPAVCSDYLCRVQLRAANAEIAEDEALDLIANARALRDQVAQILPTGQTMGTARNILDDLASQRDPLLPEDGLFAMRMYVLERFLDAQFRLGDRNRLTQRK